MKKPSVNVLVLVTCIFAALAVGFFAGRNLNRTPVRIYQTVSQTTASTEETTARTNPEATEPPVLIVDINTATAQQLQTLPGIGPVLAERIVAYREENGGFRAPEELTKVSGIGASKLEEIWDLITVGGNT